MPSVQRRVSPNGKVSYRGLVRLKGHKPKTATFLKRADAVAWGQETEIGSLNAIYTLLDKKNKLIYVGEAKDLRKRLKQKYPSIPNWTHYRYDALPKNLPDNVRVSIERMVIRSYASLLKNKSNVESIEISSYSLANDKIDK